MRNKMILYDAQGKFMNDSWYAFDGTEYHAFFLERQPGDPETRHIGHSVSRDLRSWKYCGTVLSPGREHWLDTQLATGSICKKGELWYLLFTAECSAPPYSGFAVASSPDLYHWTLHDSMVLGGKEPIPFRLTNRRLPCVLLADPYIYPEEIDGWFYAYFNAQAVDLPYNHRAVQAMMRTRDFLHWEPYKIAALDCCDRIETAQVWKHGDKWYMYGGAVTSGLTADQELIEDYHFSRFENFLYCADAFDGPVLRTQRLEFPDYPDYPGKNLYIAKVLRDTDGEDVMLVNDIGPNGVVGPYAVTYGADGITLTAKP